jgi:NitT/TauT family transport system substrate-binding protein
MLLSPPAGWGQSKARVTLKNTWVHTPNVAPVFLGLEKGFFAAEGIDLDWQDGRGSAKNVRLLGAKKLLMAFADSGTAARFISEGMPVTVVYCYLQKSPLAVMVQGKLNIRAPKDLEGKRIGIGAGSAGRETFKAMITRNGGDTSKVTLMNVSYAAMQPSFLQGKIDGYVAYFPDNVPMLRAKGGNVNAIRYADFGANALGMGVAVNNSVLTEKPETLRRLLRALTKSIQYSQDHRDEAILAMKKRAPLSIKDAKLARSILDNFLTLIHTKNTEGRPLGWMARADWEQTINILTKYGGMKEQLAAEKYYTNEYVPPAGM